MIAADEIRRRILCSLPDAEVKVRDMPGTSDHYEVRIVSASFAGRSLMARHRTVYASLRDVIGGDLHALSLEALAPGD